MKKLQLGNNQRDNQGDSFKSDKEVEVMINALNSYKFVGVFQK